MWPASVLMRRFAPGILLAISWPVLLVASDDTLARLSIHDRLLPITGGHIAPISDVPGWGVYRLEAEEQ